MSEDNDQFNMKHDRWGNKWAEWKHQRSINVDKYDQLLPSAMASETDTSF